MFPIEHPFKRSGQKILIPQEFEDIMLEYVKKCLKDEPDDLISYSLDYFTLQRSLRRVQLLGTDERTARELFEVENAESSTPMPPRVRRKTVFAETYDPELQKSDETITHPKTDEQRAMLGDVIKHILLFKALEEEQFSEVLDAMFERTVAPGDVVIEQGADGDNFYVIECGTFEASKAGEGVVYTYIDSGSFGELALLYNVPRAATITAVTPGRLWAMDRMTFRRILLNATFKKRRRYEELLDSVPMLSTLEQYERMNLADALESRSYISGQTIIQEGDAADGMYFVEDGIVGIMMTAENGEPVEVNRVGKGGYFGELALVTHKPRAATVYAMQDVRLAFLDVTAFERLLGPCMEIMKRNVDLYNMQITKIFGSHASIKTD